MRNLRAELTSVFLLTDEKASASDCPEDLIKVRPSVFALYLRLDFQSGVLALPLGKHRKIFAAGLLKVI
jgi:hypothetical protein